MFTALFVFHQNANAQTIKEEVPKAEIPKIEEPSKWAASFAMGPTYLSYAQTGIIDYNQWLLTLRASGTYRINNKWELSASSFVNLVSTYSNHEDSIKFFGWNARAGYVIQKSGSPWKFCINGGWYYLTSFGNSIGIQNLNGPQIYPTVNFQISPSKIVYGHLKFSPLANRLSILNLSNHEVAFGGGYQFEWIGRRFSVGVDLAILTMIFPQAKTASSSVTGLLGLLF